MSFKISNVHLNVTFCLCKLNVHYVLPYLYGLDAIKNKSVICSQHYDSAHCYILRSSFILQPYKEQGVSQSISEI